MIGSMQPQAIPQSEEGRNRTLGRLNNGEEDSVLSNSSVSTSASASASASGKKTYPLNRGPFPHFRRRCVVFINDPKVEKLVLGVLLLNSLFITLSTFSFVRNNESTKEAFDVIDSIFLVIFTLESLMQLVYHGIFIFNDKLLTFDLVIVVISWAFESLSVARSLRILRAIKLFSKVHALTVILDAMIHIIPHVGTIAGLLVLVFYIFAVMFTTLFKDLPLSDHYFQRLDFTFFTLFQFMTMDWAGIARECQEHIPWSPIIISVFVFLSGFIFFNLIIALLCETLSVIEEKEKEEKDDSRMRRLDELEKFMGRIQNNQKKIQELLTKENNANGKDSQFLIDKEFDPRSEKDHEI